MIRYIQDTEHYTEVLSRMVKARRLLWVATADLKDLYIKQKDEVVPFLQILNLQVKHGNFRCYENYRCEGSFDQCS